MSRKRRSVPYSKGLTSTEKVVEVINGPEGMTHIYGSGRTCAECYQPLNQYNPGKLCFSCQDRVLKKKGDL